MKTATQAGAVLDIAVGMHVQDRHLRVDTVKEVHPDGRLLLVTESGSTRCSHVDAVTPCVPPKYYVLSCGSDSNGDRRTLTISKRWAVPGHKNERRFSTAQAAYDWAEHARFLSCYAYVCRVDA